jgi:hypothetical protein
MTITPEQLAELEAEIERLRGLVYGDGDYV